NRAPSVPQRVSNVAAAHPDTVALSAGNTAISYRELDRRSGQLAGYLAQAGVGAEVPVAICLGRSVDQIVTILAVLRAGGAFVPLDPNWPLARIQRLLDDAKAPVLVAEPEIVERIRADRCFMIRLDRDAATIARH